MWQSVSPEGFHFAIFLDSIWAIPAACFIQNERFFRFSARFRWWRRPNGNSESPKAVQKAILRSRNFKWFKISAVLGIYRNHVWWCSNTSKTQGETESEARYDTSSVIRNEKFCRQKKNKKKWRSEEKRKNISRTLSSINKNHSLVCWEDEKERNY